MLSILFSKRDIQYDYAKSAALNFLRLLLRDQTMLEYACLITPRSHLQTTLFDQISRLFTEKGEQPRSENTTNTHTTREYNSIDGTQMCIDSVRLLLFIASHYDDGIKLILQSTCTHVNTKKIEKNPKDKQVTDIMEDDDNENQTEEKKEDHKHNLEQDTDTSLLSPAKIEEFISRIVILLYHTIEQICISTNKFPLCGYPTVLSGTVSSPSVLSSRLILVKEAIQLLTLIAQKLPSSVFQLIKSVRHMFMSVTTHLIKKDVHQSLDCLSKIAEDLQLSLAGNVQGGSIFSQTLSGGE